MKLYLKLLWFLGEMGSGAGEIRNTEDFGPTNQQLVVYDILKRRLDEVREGPARFRQRQLLNG